MISSRMNSSKLTQQDLRRKDGSARQKVDQKRCYSPVAEHTDEAIHVIRWESRSQVSQVKQGELSWLDAAAPELLTWTVPLRELCGIQQT